MGWGVYDYPSAPLEAAGTEDVFDCQAKACGEALRSEDLWSCADCDELFCEDHIAEVADTNGERFMGVTEPGLVFLCHACCEQRSRKRKRPRSERDDDGRGFAKNDYEDVA
jgi:hypothetical protein